VVKESSQPTTEVLLPLVENTGDQQPVETAEPQVNYSQYIVFGLMIIGLVVILILMLREKRKV